jgi:DNA-binding PadR family transcriptional regulator
MMNHHHHDHSGAGRGMEPFVLLHLASGPAHGYDIHKALADLGFRRAAEDPSRVYKLLRDLEDRGYLTSSWTPGDGGPARRTYQLTAEADAYLEDRADDLRRQAKRIDYFLERYPQLRPKQQSTSSPG